MNLPITLIAYALSNKVVNQLRLYLYLKENCSGHFSVADRRIENTCMFFGWKSEKTFHKNLNWLIQNKWVAYNSKTSSCRVLSLARLCHKLNCTTRTGVLFETKDLNHFRPFLYAAVIAWRIRCRNWQQRQPVRKKGRARKSMSMPKNQLPNRYLAHILQLDHSTVSRYKLAAAAAGYINVKHHFENLELPEKFIYMLRKSNPEEAHWLVMHKGTIHKQLPDTITTSIHLKHHRPRPP